MLNFVQLRFLKKQTNGIRINSNNFFIIYKDSVFKNRISKYSITSLNKYLNIPGVKYFSIETEISAVLKNSFVKILYQNCLYDENRFFRSLVSKQTVLNCLYPIFHIVFLINERSRTNTN